MIRFGLCCKFHEEPIRFRTATATALRKLGRKQSRARLSELCLHNAQALEQAIRYCAGHGIGAFRVSSQILPLKTHPEAGYDLDDLPGGRAAIEQFKLCGRLRAKLDIRLLFHPDQFILLNSPDSEIIRRSIMDLRYHAEVAGWIGADVINLHAGGVYGDKRTALARLCRSLRRLPAGISRRLTIENDDRCYTPADLLPVCRDTGFPMVYDLHHHRCLPDGMTVEEVTAQAMATWNREPVFHISSPAQGWKGGSPGPHSDFISPRDFPQCWRNLNVTVEVEAKAKECAILRLKKQLAVHTPTGSWK